MPIHAIVTQSEMLIEQQTPYMRACRRGMSTESVDVCEPVSTKHPFGRGWRVG